MTDEELVTGAAMAAKAAGRAVTVFCASRNPEEGVEHVGIALTEEILKDPKTAYVISLPRREALLLLADLEAALHGRFQTVEAALTKSMAKGPKA